MLSRWQSTIVDAQGNVQPGAVLTIRNELDQSLAQVYMSPSDQQPYPLGQVPADATGYAYFYAPGGLYRIQSVALGIDWREVQIGAALVSIGDYGPGLEITARNQIFWRDGELYRAGAELELPYTTTGDWSAEEGLFVAVGDAALRQEMTEVTDLLKYATYKTPRDFGGKPDDPEFDNKFALQAAFDSKEPILLDGFYYTTESHYVTEFQTVVGFGIEKSGIVKIGNKIAELGTVEISATASDDYNVDAILIVKAGSYLDGETHAKYITFKDFKIKRHNSIEDDNNLRYGLFAPRIALSEFSNFYAQNMNLDTGAITIGTGIRVVSGWMLTWNRVDAAGRRPFHFGSDDGYVNGGGTSNTFISCWARAGKVSAWRFYGMSYSNLISCGGDYIGTPDQEDTVVFDFRSSFMGMINCSTEQARAKLISATDHSSITVMNPHFKHGIYGDGTLSALVHVSGNSYLDILGGEIDRDDSATNPVYRAQYGSILNVSNVRENFTFSVHKGEFAANKDIAVVFRGNSQFYHKSGVVNKSWIFDRALAEANFQENDQTIDGSLTLTRADSVLKLTHYGATTFENPVQLGRTRLWQGVINNAAVLMMKHESDPTSASDGVILNSLLGSGTSFPTSRTPGQHFFRTDLNKPFWWNGSSWRDALGNTI